MAAPEPPGTASPKNIKVNGKYNRTLARSKPCKSFVFKLHLHSEFHKETPIFHPGNCILFQMYRKS